MRYLQVQVLQGVQIECAGQRSPGGAVSEDDRVQARQLQRQGQLVRQAPAIHLLCAQQLVTNECMNTGNVLYFLTSAASNVN
jgi:hypothetical protein